MRHAAYYSDNMILVKDMIGTVVDQLDCTSLNHATVEKFLGMALRTYPPLLLTPSVLIYFDSLKM